MHWKQISYCISRENQLQLVPGLGQNASGIFAPTIRYKDDIFYMITTNVTSNSELSGNFYVWTKDPFGEWSNPVFLGTPGIDPSLFFDDDDKDYYVGTFEEGIYIYRIDLKQGKIIGEMQIIWQGTGGGYPEGPHIYKKNGWYYLLISEGGTERGHMITMARSKNVMGPYEACPVNPVLTNRSLNRAIESVGHADLVEDQNGNWWAVCLGTRTFAYPPKHNLGRETILVPVEWDKEWPVFGENGTLEEEIETDKISPIVLEKEEHVYNCDFDMPKLDFNWNFLYNANPSMWKSGEGELELKGNACSISDLASYAWVGRRQCEHNIKASVTLMFDPKQDGEEAGMTIFLSHRHHYEAAIMNKDGEKKIIFRRQIGSLKCIEKEIACVKNEITFELEADHDYYTFYYRLQGEERKFLGKGEVCYLTTEVGEVFTGNYIALYAMGNGLNCVDTAEFSKFRYCELM